MKICIISERFYPQVVGSGTGAYLLAKGLLASGHQVTVVTDEMIGKLPNASELPFNMRYIGSFEEYVMGGQASRRLFNKSIGC